MEQSARLIVWKSAPAIHSSSCRVLGARACGEYPCAKHDDDTWWATVYTSNYYLKAGATVAKHCVKGSAKNAAVVKGYTYGALFITFNAGGDPHKAEAYFKTINGETIETFSIVKDERLVQR